jgi:hypothetical protein
MADCKTILTETLLKEYLMKTLGVSQKVLENRIMRKKDFILPNADQSDIRVYSMGRVYYWVRKFKAREAVRIEKEAIRRARKKQ